jgi:hypothetical protein
VVTGSSVEPNVAAPALVQTPTCLWETSRWKIQWVRK